MKRIEAIIRPSKIQQLCAILEKVGYSGITVSDVEGHGRQRGGAELMARGIKHRVPFVDKKRVVLVVRDKEADSIMRAIRETVCTGKIGDGKIFVSTIDNVMRISSGETGEDAV
jgi:nitrogen regulatory protein P-II 1